MPKHRRTRLRLGLPALTVLRRELSLIAAQRGTYVLRSLYALAATTVGLITYHSITFSYRHYAGYSMAVRFRAYGVGEQLLDTALIFGVISTLLLLPAMVVGSVTTEREQGTLDLMRVSRLSTWEITIQKYFARLFPFGAFLLLLVPMTSVAYCLGGVSITDLAVRLIILIGLGMRTASLALFCSALCASATTAFLLAYALTGLVFVGLPICAEVNNWYDFSEWWIVGPVDSPSLINAMVFISWASLFALALLCATLPLMARTPHQRGAFIKRLHLRLDAFLERLNRCVGNIRWGDDRQYLLPAASPVAWRERARVAICAPQHLFRITSLTVIPTLFIGLLIAISSMDVYRYPGEDPFAIFMCLLWLGAILVPAVYVANLISGERSGQTLDVLLTTPLSPAELLRQKLSAVPRIVVVSALPLLVGIGIRFWAYCDTHEALAGAAYVMVWVMAIAVYGWVVVWISLYNSLRIRRRATVVMMVLIQLLGITLLPVLLLALIDITFPFIDAEPALAGTPIGLFVELELDDYDHPWDYIHWILTGFTVYASFGAILALRCIYGAERYLYRPPHGT